MQADQRELLRQKHNFSEWRGEAGAGPVIRDFGLTGDELTGWELVRTKRQDALRPPRLDTFWQRAGEPTEILLGVHVTECASVVAAREALLDALGDFQSPGVGRRTDLGIGDVAFGDGSVLLFARGNLMVLVRNAGRQVDPVIEPARTLDAHLVRLLTRAGEERP